MAFRPCLTCGTPTQGSRCPPCARPLEAARTRAKRQVRRYTAAEQRRRAAAVREHVENHGWLCSGWPGHPPHPSRDLTADHETEVAVGGAEDGPLVVRCRSVNSSRSAALRR